MKSSKKLVVVCMHNTIIALLFQNKLLVNILCLVFLYFIFKDLFKKRKRKKKKNTRRNKVGLFLLIKQTYKKCSLKTYFVLRKAPILKDVLYNLRMNIIIQKAIDDEEEIILMVGESIFFIILSFCISYILSLKYFGDIILATISAFITTILLYNKRKDYKIKFLEALVEIIGDMVHAFNAEQSNLDKTFERVLATDNRLKKHFSKIFQCVKKADLVDQPELVIQEYNKYSPSKYLRIICNYLYITYRYGDEVINEESMFNKNMLAIQREVNNEAEKVLQIRDETFGEVLFIVSPIYFLPLAKSYLLNYFVFEGFEKIEQFLQSNYGYMVMILCAFITLICFYLYNKIMFYGDVLEERTFVSWEENILKKSRRLRKIIFSIVPKQDSAKYLKVKKLLIKSGERKQITVFYFRKFIIAVSVFLCLIVFFTFQNYTSKYSVLNDIYKGLNKNLFQQVLLVQDNPEVYKEKSIENDKKVIEYLQNSMDYLSSNREENQEQIRSYIKKNQINYGAYSDYAVERILSKAEILSNKSKYIEILLFISIVTLLAYWIPNVGLYLKVYLNKELMLYDETMGLYTITILLVNHPSSNTKIILEWLTNFSNVFFTPLRECLDNYSDKALKQINRVVVYKPFNRLIESLILSFEGVDIKKAFAGIEQKQLFQEKSRERNNKKIAKVKVGIIRGLSYTSLITTVVLYMLIPLIIAAIDMFINLT